VNCSKIGDEWYIKWHIPLTGLQVSRVKKEAYIRVSWSKQELAIIK
jgi:hypothetical protein